MSGLNPSIYNAKCLNGPYVDRRKEPEFEGVRPSIQTEQQIRNAAVCHLPNPTFGASLRSTYANVKTIEDDLDYSNIIYPDRRYHGGTWASLASTMHFGAKQRASGTAAVALARDTAVFSTTYHLRGPAMVQPGHESELKAYRATWQNDSRGVFAVTERFGTAVQAGTGGASVPLRFQTQPARPRAGATRTADVLSSRLVTSRGVDALLRFMLALPPRATMDKFALRHVLAGFSVKLSIDEEKELLRVSGFQHPTDPVEYLVEPFSFISLLVNPEAGEHALSPMRQAAVERAWTQIREAERLLSGSTEPTLGAAIAAVDPPAHPDAKTRPPLHTGSAVIDIIREGLCACIRKRAQADTLASPGRGSGGADTPRSPEDSSADALAATAAATQRASSVGAGVRAASHIVRRSHSAVFPLAISRRTENQDWMEVGGVPVGVPGAKHRDPAAGGGKAALSAAAAVETPDPAELAAAEGVAVAAAAVAPLADGTPLDRDDFFSWASFISAAMPSDDAFERFFDGGFHATLTPHVRASYDTREPKPRTVPSRTRGQLTAHAEVGAGLRFAAQPYAEVPRAPPARLVSKFDPDVASSQIAMTHALVLITRASGKKELVTVTRDRFFKDDATAEELLRRVHALGGYDDAVDAVIDFA